MKTLEALLWFFKDKKLKINMISVEWYKNKCQAEGTVPGTISRELACLKVMFSKAIKCSETRSNSVMQIKFFQKLTEKNRKNLTLFISMALN